ncbi:hypothetical protein AAVH_02650 [Aphelenchoides avenae]|nr:hypothetical protein AAVH_02650 [Aphelenchus avenae]
MSSLAWQLASCLIPALTLFACVLLGLLNCKAKKKKPPEDAALRPPGTFPSNSHSSTSIVRPGVQAQTANKENAAPGDPVDKKHNDDAKKEATNKKAQDCEQKPAAVTSKEKAKDHSTGPPKADKDPKSNPILSNPLVTPITDECPTGPKEEKQPDKPEDDKHRNGSAQTLERTQTEADPTQEC